jgi:hypothetical protein
VETGKWEMAYALCTIPNSDLSQIVLGSGGEFKLELEPE